MSKRPYDLPPLNALASFEAAARNVSFKAAARELNVTPAAVSHQVKALEAELDCALFYRVHKGVELTETGAYLLVALQKGFEEISESIAQLRARRARSAVTIRSSTAVSSFWLTPKLAQFWQQYGHIQVAQVVDDFATAASDVDLSIHYGDLSQETGPCQALFHDRITALGSPRFAERHQIRSVEDLAQVPLIHLDAPETGWTDWAAWMAALGCHAELNTAHRVNNYVIALQAAQDDMGAVLGWGGLISDLVDRGKLVQLVPDAMSSPQDFYIKLHNQSSDRARLVFNWLAREGADQG